jgi:hypothetical protein
MEPEQPFHTEAMLLPGYVNQTLSPEEEQQVTNHLKGCVTCQQELQEVNNMQAAIKSSIAQRPGPSPAAFPTLMRRIEQEKQAQQRQASQPTTTSWWQTVEAAFRSLFEIQWVPALASVLIVGQAFLLLSVVNTPVEQQGQEPGGIIERSIPPGTPATPPIKIYVKFVETAQAIQIRKMLKELDGQIVNGPTTEGLYTLEFPRTEMSASQALLATLNGNQELIKNATSLNPKTE